MIEEKRIKRNLKRFAFPRLSGTKFELKAFNQVKTEVKNLNLDYKVQNFTFSSFYSRIYPKIAFSSGSLIYLFLYLTYHPIISPIIIGVLIAILTLSFLLTRKPERIQFIKKLNSQNLLVKIKSKSDKMKNNDRKVLFISHLDSKGQRFKIQIRIKTIKLWISTSIILAVTLPFKFLIYIGLEDIFYIIGGTPLILNIIASVILVLNATDNSSEGAVDNASGIACNLELLNHYSIDKNRLNNYDIWFLFTGAEECGTMGARHFYNTLENYDPNKSVAFNFESIAKHVYLFPGGKESNNAKDIDNFILNNDRSLKINHYITNRVLGTHSDGGFLGSKRFQGYGIGEVEAYEYMHTPNDSLDKIDTTILKKLCLVLTDSLKKHDSTFFK
ncbi:MAG: M20/M25/M40 family metallo-hydrolase [Candidatus Lokiarchaeota archaeon]|nr:M20/M25/M40 family metallo-hydrolase [Candidatus Lokiarchaeota archaeon]